jgi:hypothetical protein
MRSRDTSEKAAAIHDRVLDALGPEGRFELAMQMSELAREFALAGLRDQHPDWTDAQLRRELVRLFYGR